MWLVTNCIRSLILAMFPNFPSPCFDQRKNYISVLKIQDKFSFSILYRVLRKETLYGHVPLQVEKWLKEPILAMFQLSS